LVLSGSGSKSVKPEHGTEEAVKILWKSIVEARLYMSDPLLTSEEKRRWAKTLADMIGVYNKLLSSLGEEQLEDDDLGTLLTRVPVKERKIVLRRVRMWRKKSLFATY
jgi:hypothetical protein